TASLEVVEGSSDLLVTGAVLDSINVSPSSATVAQGSRQPFKASGAYSDHVVRDLTDSATWTSSNTAVATISNAPGTRGIATALAEGQAEIRGASGGLTSAPAILRVTVPTTLLFSGTTSQGLPILFNVTQ